ncbi:MAG: SIMPL domain-containing protein [Pseudozobellia sp.]|nr:SIMPL domain-containing protein [Pseudozobellia sp.]MBG48555.1 SIMPL domain-containing protein [Pseudozobellia sp.]|tara:strand:- start:535248 stop:535958 length:711 start_codon:yes stop_codon:yes gene_type:complete
MKDLNWIKTLILAIAIMVAGYFVGNMHRLGKKYDRYVQVKGLSEREVDADLAVWPMNISLTGNDLVTLRQDIEGQNQKVVQFFKEQGFTDDELTRGTINVTDARANIYNNGSQYSEYRYLATIEITVRTSDIPRLQKALAESSELISDGVLLGSKNSWRPIEYMYTKLNDLKPEMVEEATKNAREVAEKFARDSQAKVGEIRVARQGLFSISDRDQNTPQIKLVRVVSTIDFQLED